MPTVTFNHELLRRLQLNANVVHNPDVWADKLELPRIIFLNKTIT